MFEAIIEAKHLKQYVDAVTAIDEEARVNVEKNGLRTAVVGPANVIMCRTMLGSAAFESFEADGRVQFGVQFTGSSNKVCLDDALGFLDAEAVVQLRYDPDTEKLHVNGDGHEFELATLDAESIRQEPDIPNVELPNRYVLESRDLSNAVKASKLASDHFRIRGDPDSSPASIDVHAKGDTDGVNRTLELGDELLDDSEITAGVESIFPCKQMQGILKPIPPETVVDGRFGAGMPMKWSYDYASTEGSVTNFIAPRIED